MATETEDKEFVPTFEIKSHPTDIRAYQNPFPDYMSAMSNETSLIHIAQEIVISTDFINKIKYFIAEQLEVIGDNYLDKLSYQDDKTVYTGSCGLAFLYIKLGNGMYKRDSKAAKSFLEMAGEILETARDEVYKAYPAFLMGDGGPWTLSILHAQATGDKDSIAKYTAELVHLHHHVVCSKKNNEDELLYGSAGYLYCLLLVRKLVPEANINDELVKKVSDVLVEHGIKLAQSLGPIPPLMYSFAAKQYIGAAHGLAGVVYILLCSAELMGSNENMDNIISCLEYLQGVKYASGNFPTQFGDTDDMRLHWCHGAPGIAVLFCKAYSVTHNIKYLKTAVQAARLVWDRGLIKKGISLCHGVAGNAYTFLQLFKVTQDAEYLYNALKFAEWCIDATKARGRPDRPFTLFEGLAGAIYFLNDLLDIKNAAFPGYEL
ncbi:LanC-like protein 2 [Oopsacas minuta]|uniref:LanC-like protein 2 n=1 Tax=Oopsacas minuta TaxID=111878 RepID=A0AAV7KJK2_9METZ|nr:LanC-like protein 2 [Oopsacas minuta]